MGGKTWNIQLDGKLHVIELEDSWSNGSKKISVDGKVVLSEAGGIMQSAKMKADYPFEIGDHKLVIHFFATRFDRTYDLSVDGISQETGGTNNAATEQMYLTMAILVGGIIMGLMFAMFS